MGATRAILTSGYSIDSLMIRYQGVDWRDTDVTDPKHPCNGGLNPLQPKFNDGVDVSPLEAMFVKVKSAMVAAEWPSAVAAVTLDRWLNVTSSSKTKRMKKDVALLESVRSNRWLNEISRKERLLAENRGQACFDWEFFLESNAMHLGFMLDEDDAEDLAWEYFIEHGIYEGRPYRWQC